MRFPTLGALCVLAACSAAVAHDPSAPEDAGVEPEGPHDATAPARDALGDDAAPDAPTDAEATDAAVDADATVDAAPPGPFACTADDSYATSVNLAEASAATEVELTANVRELLVVSDSGGAGAALAKRLSNGVTRHLTLPLDAAASDDLEGIAWRGGRLYTLTSSGAVRRFTPDGTGGLTRDQNAYALGAEPYACADLAGINCGKNYEGLCLRAVSADEPCAGYAASRAEGKLYCLVLDGAGVLSASTTQPPIDLDVAGDSLSDCAFGAAGAAQGVLAVATNVYNGSRSYRVDEANGALTKLPTTFVLNLESVAIDHDGALYTFSDDNSESDSPTHKLACENW